MSVVQWPAHLPPPLRRGYSVQPQSAAAITPFPEWPIARPVQSDAPARISLTFAFDPAQQSDFDGFFAHQLAQGTRDLLMPIRNYGQLEMRVVNFLGEPPRRDPRGAKNDTYIGSVITRSGMQPAPEVFAGYLNENDHIIG